MVTIEIPDKEKALQIACEAGLLGTHGTQGYDIDGWVYDVFLAIVKAAEIKTPDAISSPIPQHLVNHIAREKEGFGDKDDYSGHALY
jgi:hypothetical protein